MTKRQAMVILIEHAANNVRGAGVGMRPEISEATRLQVAAAVDKVFRDVYDREPQRSDFFNLGLDAPEHISE